MRSSGAFTFKSGLSTLPTLEFDLEKDLQVSFLSTDSNLHHSDRKIIRTAPGTEKPPTMKMRSHSDVISSPMMNSDDREVSSNEQEDHAVNRAHFALREYLSCVCEQRTVIFFFDDVQWAEHEAILFFRTLLLDVTPQSQSRSFLFLAAHRPLPRGHNWQILADDLEQGRSVERLRSCGSLISKAQYHVRPQAPLRIFVDRMEHGAIVELVSRLLRREKEDVKELVDLVERKTAGNCFFVIEYVQLLENMGLVHFSLARSRWEWADLNEISSQTTISDNVVDIVAAKIRHAPEDISSIKINNKMSDQSLFLTYDLSKPHLPSSEKSYDFF